eukprot:365775-Chlamydomonas_euryale.AAC.11
MESCTALSREASVAACHHPPLATKALGILAIGQEACKGELVGHEPDSNTLPFLPLDKTAREQLFLPILGTLHHEVLARAKVRTGLYPSRKWARSPHPQMAMQNDNILVGLIGIGKGPRQGKAEWLEASSSDNTRVSKV